MEHHDIHTVRRSFSSPNNLEFNTRYVSAGNSVWESYNKTQLKYNLVLPTESKLPIHFERVVIIVNRHVKKKDINNSSFNLTRIIVSTN